MSATSLQRVDASDACVVSMSGEVDLGMAPEVRSVLNQALELGCTEVLLDLADVTYADSTALGLIVWLDSRLAPLGGRVVLCGPNADVARILEVCGLVGIVPTISASSSVAEALAGIVAASSGSDPLWEETIETEASAARLTEARQRVEQLIEPLGIDASTVFDIKVAVGEALANAVRHGSPHGEEDRVLLRVTAYPDKVAVEVRDTGPGFDGSTDHAQDPFAEGGRGVMFMRALMDSVSFGRSPDGGTTVMLVKAIRQPA